MYLTPPPQKKKSLLSCQRSPNLIGRSYLVTVLCVSWKYNQIWYFLSKYPKNYTRDEKAVVVSILYVLSNESNFLCCLLIFRTTSYGCRSL